MILITTWSLGEGGCRISSFTITSYLVFHKVSMHHLPGWKLRPKIYCFKMYLDFDFKFSIFEGFYSCSTDHLVGISPPMWIQDSLTCYIEISFSLTNYNKQKHCRCELLLYKTLIKFYWISALKSIWWKSSKRTMQL